MIYRKGLFSFPRITIPICPLKFSSWQHVPNKPQAPRSLILDPLLEKSMLRYLLWRGCCMNQIQPVQVFSHEFECGAMTKSWVMVEVGWWTSFFFRHCPVAAASKTADSSTQLSFSRRGVCVWRVDFFPWDDAYGLYTRRPPVFAHGWNSLYNWVSGKQWGWRHRVCHEKPGQQCLAFKFYLVLKLWNGWEK